MRINKVIHIYFAFIMTISSLALAGQNEAMREQYSSVLNSFENVVFGYQPESEPVVIKKKRLNLTSFENEIFVDILPGRKYASSGEKGVEVMTIEFKPNEWKISVEELELEVYGEGIRQLYLRAGEKWISGDQDESVWKFEGTADSEKWTVIADIEEEVKVGDRLKVDIKSLGKIKSYLPVEGEYLTIIKNS